MLEFYQLLLEGGQIVSGQLGERDCPAFIILHFSVILMFSQGSPQEYFAVAT